jgi:hypothetical protein
MTNRDESDLVERRARRLGALLAATDPPPPALAFPAERVARAARRRAAVRWRAAAALAVFAVGAVAVQPVRAWIVQAAHVLWAAAAGSPRPAPAPGPAGAREPAGRVAFIPAAGTFTVRLRHRQAGGTLTIATDPGDSAIAYVAAGGSGEVTVLPDGLRVANDPGDTAAVVVRVPSTLRRVAVAVGSAAPLVLTPSTPGERWTVDLGSGR